jgi:small subunit ribosomal protein S8
MMTDPIADMFSRIRNASMAFKDDVRMEHSGVKEELARILTREGYVSGYRTEEEPPKRTLIVQMKYGPERERVISGLDRISKPGRRVFADRAHLPRVQGGLGVAIISTSQGVMTDRQAARRGIGGEVLCYVW